MALIAMLIDANHAALEDREEAFGAVHVDLPTNPFLFGMVDGAVACEAPTNRGIGAAFIGHQFAFGISVTKNDRPQSASIQIIHGNRSGCAATLDESNDGHALCR